MIKKTKILATIGPASESPDTLRQLVDAGMDAIRINLSHSDKGQYDPIIENIRKIKDMPIIFDTQGPEVRIMCEGTLELKAGEKMHLSFDSEKSPYLTKDIRKSVQKGQKIMINDGIFVLKITEMQGDMIEVEAQTDCEIRDRTRINLPGINLGFDILSEEDIMNIKHGMKRKIDFIALSYTRDAEDVRKVRKLLGDSGIGIISKIETPLGVENFEEILKESDGIMVARGDLGIEIKNEKLPLVQKHMIKRCNQAGKFVITATQMLLSMVNSPKPTRAETSDVANAILDGTDIVMLSEETARGRYPVKAVKEMSTISKEVEDFITSKVIIDDNITISQAISKSVYELANVLPITKIVTMTLTGYTARIISRFRLRQEIIAVTPEEKVRKMVSMYFGVYPVEMPLMPPGKKLVGVTKELMKKKLIEKDDLILFTEGVFAKTNTTNLVEIHKAKDIIDMEKNMKRDV